MWFFPFIAGSALTWIALEVFQNRAQKLEHRMDLKIEELQSEMTGEARTVIREEVARVKTQFLPFLSGLVGSNQDAYGQVGARGLLSKLPGVGEALAMYYAMIDPETPWSARLEVAAALTYLISPHDWLPDTLADSELDDAAVIYYAYSKVQEYVKPKHLARARAWLKNEGVSSFKVREPMPELAIF